MHRTVVLFALLLLVPSLAGASRTAAPKGTIFVGERQSGTITAFDAASGAVLWTTKVGSSPIGLTEPPGTNKLYSSEEGSNQLSVLDPKTGALLKTIPTGPLPHHMMASRYGKRIFVAAFGKNEIDVVDTVTDTRIAGWSASPDATARTHAVWISRDGSDLYATNTRLDRTLGGDVAHLDGFTGKLLCNTPVGTDPSEVLVRPDGRIGYVSVRGENKVKELDVTGDCPRLTGREAAVGTQPDTLRLAVDGKTLVVALRGTPAQVVLLDTKTFELRTVTIPGHGTTGHEWLSPNGKLTFVALESPAGVAVLDNESASVVADYAYPVPPGGARAHGVFYDPKALR